MISESMISIDFSTQAEMNNQEIAFGRRLEMNFRYVCNSLLIADADADGNLEICAGSRDGVLCVYKFDQPDPWRISAPILNSSGSIGGPFGLITSLVVGDLFNKAMMVLVAISADGMCHACRVAGNGSGQLTGDQILQPCFKQLLPSNIQAAYIGDIDGDGQCELIVALTDRVVRTYRFLPCATVSATGNVPISRPPHAAMSGTGFCCGYLVALNKWESPAQITAFSVCPSSILPDSGANILLSQPGDKYLLLKPKLCSENDTADNLSDISVVYCETARPSIAQKSAVEKAHGAEHRSSHKSSNMKGDSSNGKRKRRLFIAANSYRIDLFHLTSRYLTVIDNNHEYRIDFPTQIFSVTPVKVLTSKSNLASESAAMAQYRDLLISCDWANNIYACSVDCVNQGGQRGKEDEKLRRVTSTATMKAYGPIMCFAAGYSERMAPNELFLAVSTSEEKLFLYTVSVSKIFRVLGK